MLRLPFLVHLLSLSLVLCLALSADGYAADARALQAGLRHIERLPKVAWTARETALDALAPSLPQGSEGHLEYVYLRGLLLAQQDHSQTLAQFLSQELPRLEVHLPWSRGWLQPLLQAEGHLEAHRMHEAQAVQGWPEEATLKRLPALWQWRIRTVQARLEEVAGDTAGALLAHLESVRLAQLLGDADRQARALSALAYAYVNEGNLDRALRTSEEAMQWATRDPDDALLATVYKVQAIVLSERGALRAARQATEATLKHARATGDLALQALVLGNLSDTYLKAGDYPEALRVAERALPVAIEAGNPSAHSLALHNSGIAKIALRRVAEGRAQVHQAIRMDTEAGNLESASAFWDELATALERAGDLPGAWEALREHQQLSVQLNRSDQSRQLAQAQARHDQGQRQREAQLLAQQNALGEQAIRARNLSLVLGGLLLASGAVVLGLLTVVLRKLRRTNKDLADTNQALNIQSNNDPLTGLGNRRHFQARLHEHLLGPAFQGTLLILDIDRFKQVNDHFGHAGGDTVLCAVAARLRAAVRDADTLVRWGGEEFVVLLPRADDAQAQTLAQRLLDSLAHAPVALRDGRQVAITASIGYASFPLPGFSAPLDWERAIDTVDALMYAAKSHGRNQAWGLLVAEAADNQALQALLQNIDAPSAQAALRLCRLKPSDTASDAPPLTEAPA